MFTLLAYAIVRDLRGRVNLYVYTGTEKSSILFLIHVYEIYNTGRPLTSINLSIKHATLLLTVR